MLFAFFINELVDQVIEANVCCFISSIGVSVFLYADDILLIAPTNTGLQRLLTISGIKLGNLDMHVNVNKCMCTILVANLILSMLT